MQKPAELLVVDDSVTALEALRATVEPLNATVTTATSGEEALRCLLNQPDMAAILMDVGLPGIDGFEIARRLRALDAHRPVLIALTGYGQPEDRRRATEAGFDEMLVKPVDPSALADLLATLEIPGPGSRG